MEQDSEKVQLRSTRDQKIIEFSVKLRDLSDIVAESDPEEVLDVDIDVKTLEVIKEFCEVHDYEASKVTWETPLKSDILQDHIDKASYNIMKDYYGHEHAEKIKPLIDAVYYLNLTCFKEICLITLGCPFYIGQTEQDKEKFKEKWGIGEISPEDERRVMDENKPVFEKINNIFYQKMQEEKEKFEASIKEDEDE